MSTALEIALFCATRQRDYFEMDRKSALKAEYEWRSADARERDQIRKDLREAQEKLIRDRLWGDNLVDPASRMVEILDRGESTAAERQLPPGTNADVYSCGCRYPNDRGHDRVYGVRCPTCFSGTGVEKP